MTTPNEIPVIEYTGNGVITQFDWDWKMITDSSINVLVDNTYVQNWSLQGKSVVFDTAPPVGAEIIIFRRTIPWQPDNYQAFGRFHSEKTELSMDRQTMIAQERQGNSLLPWLPNGIVGGSDLHTSRQEFTFTVISERGTDAVLPMYIPDDNDTPAPPDPDPDVLVWGDGDTIYAGIYSLAGNTAGVQCTMTWKMDLVGGDPAFASVSYPYYNAINYANWCAVDPDDYEYWMRVTQTSSLPASRYIVSDGTYAQALGVAFPIRGQLLYPDYIIVDRFGNILSNDGEYITPRDASIPTTTSGPYIGVHTFGDTAPTTRTGTFTVEICKDDGTGLPDGGWESRTVQLEARFNDAVKPPVDTTGSTPWATFFGEAFQLANKSYDELKIIPTAGISIAFTVPVTGSAYSLSFLVVENTAVSSTRTGSVGQTVGAYTASPTYTWGTGGGISCGINFAGTDISLTPGETYFFCVKNDTPSATQNYIRIKAYVQEQ